MRDSVWGAAAVVALLLPAAAAPAPAARWRVGAEGAAGNAAFAALRDPATGYGWELRRGQAGGPGRWVRSAAAAAKRPAREAKRNADVPLAVRAGERLTVTESTARAAVEVQVIALEPAAPGASLRVRSAIGGRVLRAVALGDGRARLLGSGWRKP